jgi:hypothetical protein
MSSDLLNLRASALNQNDQHKNKEHAGSNSDNCRSVHRDTPFPRLDPSFSMVRISAGFPRSSINRELLHTATAALD